MKRMFSISSISFSFGNMSTSGMHTRESLATADLVVVDSLEV
jgi:hypothetical protein